MIINNNINAIKANRFLKINSIESGKTAPQISSGSRIPNGAEEALGGSLLGQARFLMRAQKNTQDGVSFIQTAEGYLEETINILQRIRELSVQASNGIYNNEDRLYMQTEVSSLIYEIDRVASQAQFNTLKIFTGRFSNTVNASASMWIHIGANMDQRKRIYISTMTANSLGLKNVISISSMNNANRTIGIIDNAVKIVMKQRADLGAYQNRFENYTYAIMNTYENFTSSGSKIMDTDMAEASIIMAKGSIKSQASLSILVQANNLNRNALNLLN